MLKLRTTEFNGGKICSVIYNDDTWYLASDFFASIGITDELEQIKALREIPVKEWKILVCYDPVSRDMMPAKFISSAGVLSFLAKRGV